MLYINSEHPTVQKIARQIKQAAHDDAEIVAGIFHYVRDDILFGFHPEVDALSASDIIERGSGQCNNKSIVFMALCRALDIPAKLYFSDIDRSIHRGFIPEWAYNIFPKNISHSWVDVQIDGKWHRIDGYINDISLFLAGREALIQHGWQTGFSVSDPTQTSADFSLEQENYVQMATVTRTHGVYDDPADYFRSSLYQNHPGGFKQLIAGYIMRQMNHRVEQLRAHYLQAIAI